MLHHLLSGFISHRHLATMWIREQRAQEIISILRSYRINNIDERMSSVRSSADVVSRRTYGLILNSKRLNEAAE